MSAHLNSENECDTQITNPDGQRVQNRAENEIMCPAVFPHPGFSTSFTWPCTVPNESIGVALYSSEYLLHWQSLSLLRAVSKPPRLELANHGTRTNSLLIYNKDVDVCHVTTLSRGGKKVTPPTQNNWFGLSTERHQSVRVLGFITRHCSTQYEQPHASLAPSNLPFPRSPLAAPASSFCGVYGTKR